MNGQFAHGLGRDPAGGTDSRVEHMVPQRRRNTEVAVFTHEVMTHVMLLDHFPDAPAHGPLMAGVMGQIVQDVAGQESEDEPGAGIPRQSVAERPYDPGDGKADDRRHEIAQMIGRLSVVVAVDREYELARGKPLRLPMKKMAMGDIFEQAPHQQTAKAQANRRRNGNRAPADKGDKRQDDDPDCCKQPNGRERKHLEKRILEKNEALFFGSRTLHHTNIPIEKAPDCQQTSGETQLIEDLRILQCGTRVTK